MTKSKPAVAPQDIGIVMLPPDRFVKLSGFASMKIKDDAPVGTIIKGTMKLTAEVMPLAKLKEVQEASQNILFTVPEA